MHSTDEESYESCSKVSGNQTSCVSFFSFKFSSTSSLSSLRFSSSSMPCLPYKSRDVTEQEKSAGTNVSTCASGSSASIMTFSPESSTVKGDHGGKGKESWKRMVGKGIGRRTGNRKIPSSSCSWTVVLITRRFLSVVDTHNCQIKSTWADQRWGPRPPPRCLGAHAADRLRCRPPSHTAG